LRFARHPSSFKTPFILQFLAMTLAARYSRSHKNRRSAPSAAQERDALIEAHLPQVRFIADRLAAKLPPSVDRDDLIGAGVLGLLDAFEKYDPSRGVLFKTYAEMRVRGAMLDSLRDLDWAPRSMRRRAREVEAAYAQVEQQRGHKASEEEVAAALNLTVAEFQQLLSELNGLTITGFERDDDDDASARARQIQDDPAHTPLAVFERAELREKLAAAVDRLSERERQVVALYYLEELTMKEIGAVLGVTESRVSQVHTQAVLRLRANLQAVHASGALAY
jgi:RNA polymerase sigma factor for flagellar operon FliA